MIKVLSFSAAAACLLAVSGPAVATIIASDNFNDGNIDNWTVNSLWHVTSNAPQSGSHALGYVQEETQPSQTPDGNFNTGSRNSGAATSFAFNCNGFAACVVSFDLLKITESGSFDQLTVRGLASNGNVLSSDTITTSNSAYFTYGFQLDSLTTKVQFFFDTIDSIANSTAGVRIDDFIISDEIARINIIGTPSADGDVAPGLDAVDVPAPGALALLGLGLAGLGLRRRSR